MSLHSEELKSRSPGFHDTFPQVWDATPTVWGMGFFLWLDAPQEFWCMDAHNYCLEKSTVKRCSSDSNSIWSGENIIVTKNSVCIIYKYIVINSKQNKNVHKKTLQNHGISMGKFCASNAPRTQNLPEFDQVTPVAVEVSPGSAVVKNHHFFQPFSRGVII